MHIFILGMGHVGKALAGKLYATGYRVTHPDPNAHILGNTPG